MLATGAALLAAAPLGQAWAQAWPNKPVNIVVPFPAGGGTDAFARPLFANMSKTTGRQFVIDNKGGAGGTLGAGLAPRRGGQPRCAGGHRAAARAGRRARGMKSGTGHGVSFFWAH